MSITHFAERLGHSFSTPALLINALTHPSINGQSGHRQASNTDYERLEFLGDRVLGLVVAAWLYEIFPHDQEGDLAKRHAALVNRATLKTIALTLELEQALQVAASDKAATQRSHSVLADALEAIIGALYLDGGLATATSFIKQYWQPILTSQTAMNDLADPKTILQEWAQKRGFPLPTYSIIERHGPAHAPLFVVELTVRGQPALQARGDSKREAEKRVAALMLDHLNILSSHKAAL